MPIDPSIPLSFNPLQPAPDMGRSMTLASLGMQMQEKSRAFQAQNALRELLSNPGSIDPATGMPTPETRARVMAIDPNTGMSLVKNALAAQSQQGLAAVRQSQLYGAKQEVIGRVRDDSLNAYDAALKAGMPDDQARAAGQKILADGLTEAKGGGIFSEDEIGRLPSQFDPMRFRAHAMSYKDRVAAERLEAGTRRQEAAEQERERHNRVVEGRLAAGSANREEAGWQVMSDPERKDADGNLIPAQQYRYNPRNAQATTLDGQPYTPAGAARVGTPKTAPSEAFSAPTQVTVPGEDGKTKRVLAQQNKKTGQWVTADEKHEPIEGVTDINRPGSTPPNDEHIGSVAKQVAEYRMAPPSMGRNSPYGAAIMDEVMKLNPEYDATSWQQKSKAIQAFSTGKQGDAVRSFNVGISHLNTLQDLSDALKNSDVKLFNTLANKWGEQTGATAPTNFDTAKQIIGAEIVKAIVGAGGGVTERQEAAGHISRSNSPEQLAGAIATVKELMRGQLSGLKSQYERTTKLKNFDEEFLSPEARQVFSKSKAGASDKLPGTKAAMEKMSDEDILKALGIR